MKKLLAIAVIVTAFAASQSFAQTSANATVKMNVNTALGIAATNNIMTLPNAVPGSRDSLSYTDPNAAFFTVSGTANTTFSINWSSTSLTNGSWNLTPTFYIAGNDTTLSASATQITAGHSQPTNASGLYYFWTGAAVNVPSNAAGGAYQGTVTLTISGF